MKAVILTGGLGTRLREVTGELPKGMADINGKPFLEHLIERLKHYDFNEFILCVGHMADKIAGYFGDGRLFGVSIYYTREEKLLGTAGAVKLAGEFIDSPFLVLNGDTYLDIDYAKFYEFFTDRKADAAIALADNPKENRYARITVDSKGRINEYSEKKIERGGSFISSGNYIFTPGIFKFIPENKNVSLEREVIPALLAQGREVFGFYSKGYFNDIGTPDSLNDFRNYMNSRNV